MSRKDGLSTNAELLADFRCASREVFVQAYQRKIAGNNMSPEFQDKPLSSLYVTVSSTPVEPTLGRVSVLAEMLVAQPIDTWIGPMVESHPSLSKLPDDVKNRYRTIGASVSQIVLSRGLQIASVLPMEAVKADYVALMSSGEQQTAGVFETRQTKPRLAAAKYFAEEALQYVRSDEFMADEESQDSRLSCRYGLEISLNLPLNGYESRQFLIEYRRAMVAEYNRYLGVDAQPVADEDKAVIGQIKAHMQACAAAAERAQAILDRRNDYEE